MLSHWPFNRKGQSNPSSPVNDLPIGRTTVASPLSNLLEPAPLHDARPKSSTAASLPPSLPPINRVTSSDSLGAVGEKHLPDPDPRARTLHRDDGRGFMGGRILEQFRREPLAALPRSAHSPLELRSEDERSSESGTGFPKLSPLTRSSQQSTQQQRPATSFVAPTDLQSPSAHGGSQQPVGTALTIESAFPPGNVIQGDAQKAKRSLPFLKNPMSTLLNRKKANQKPLDLLPPAPVVENEEQPYDPRIKGTRIHDFSAPRRTVVSPVAAPLSQSASQPSFSSGPSGVNKNVSSHSAESRLPNSISAPESIHPAYGTEARQPNYSFVDNASTTIKEGNGVIPTESSQSTSEPSVTDSRGSPLTSKPSTPARSMSRDLNSITSADDSIRTTRSRNISLSDKDMSSGVPRHMKSTSSRFSFDMIGAAKQEKQLEERHRQKELEKEATKEPDFRDSRFEDDFDEDAFDYDAMMDDDGLEEPIPGVNADYELDDHTISEDMEEFADPDDDQANFSGFVFERSNPVSSLPTPRLMNMMSTPKDNDGNAVGYAISKNSPEALEPHEVEFKAPEIVVQGQISPSGLGIQNMDFAESTVTHSQNHTVTQDEPVDDASEEPNPGDDDLYYENGLLGYENEFADDLDGETDTANEPFDESIFDIDDTDQYGRPLPGAFAEAQSRRKTEAEVESKMKRESDLVSRGSATTGVLSSTAHTSLSAELGNPKIMNMDSSLQPPDPHLPESYANPVLEPNEAMVEYQAALAVAALNAEASGKFQRSATPNEDDSPTSLNMDNDDLTLTEDNALQDYEDSYENMDDLELDDDAIIAAANESALANDADGWYGQEFGFYSAPGSQSHGQQRTPSASNEFDYANGGYFGPSGGLARSQSGHMISREPNLTPITERSEYSNRNSFMTFGVPPLISGTPIIQSPGLAQLAMMGDRDDDMTLSSLLRLRSKAFGGSQASLISSRDGSPRDDRGDGRSSPWSQIPLGPSAFQPLPHSSGHVRKNSAYSGKSYDSENGSQPGSPTLTSAGFTFPPPNSATMPSHPGRGNNLAIDTAYPSIAQPQGQGIYTKAPSSAMEYSDAPQSGLSNRSVPEWSRTQETRGTPLQARRSGANHRHKGSAESISYIQEEDCGETRWVMERRRTDELGEVEILEREVVEGGRI